MKRFKVGKVLCCTAVFGLMAPAVASAETFIARLNGNQEVPANTSASTGQFIFNYNPATNSGNYALSYANLQGVVQQAHIHIGQPGVAGGVSIWLCGTVALPGPAGTPTCPQSGVVSGTINATVGPPGQKVIGPAAQLVAAGELAEVVIRALRTGNAYVNVHTDLVPGGEIRGLIQ